MEEINDICMEMLKKFIRVSSYMNSSNEKLKDFYSNRTFYHFFDPFARIASNSSDSVQKMMIDIVE